MGFPHIALLQRPKPNPWNLQELSTVEKVVPGVEPLAASAVEKPAAAAAVADTSAAAAKRLIGPLVDYESDSEEEDGGSADEESAKTEAKAGFSKVLYWAWLYLLMKHH